MDAVDQKYTLITNVGFVRVGGVHCDAHAVLIEPPFPPFVGRRDAKVRGFGANGAWPVFTLWLGTEDASFELVDAHDPSKILIGDDGRAQPIFRGGLLRIGGHEIFVQVDDDEQEFLVEEFDSDAILKVWEELPERVARFWRAPYMPSLQWGSADEVRRMYQARRRLSAVSNRLWQP